MEAVAYNPVLSRKAEEDYKLVRQAVAGNQRAYSSLMDRYWNSVYQMMLRMVNNPEDASDLTQEAFGKAFTKLAFYAPTFAFSTWLFRIAINNAIDFVRKKRVRCLSLDDPIEPESDQDYSASLDAEVRNPEEEIIRWQRLKLMRSLLDQLNEKYRVMIELRYFDELSYEEISESLDLPLGTVKAQLFRAKEMLYELLQRPGASAYLDRTRR